MRTSQHNQQTFILSFIMHLLGFYYELGSGVKGFKSYKNDSDSVASHLVRGFFRCSHDNHTRRNILRDTRMMSCWGYQKNGESLIWPASEGEAKPERMVFWQHRAQNWHGHVKQRIMSETTKQWNSLGGRGQRVRMFRAPMLMARPWLNLPC